MIEVNFISGLKIEKKRVFSQDEGIRYFRVKEHSWILPEDEDGSAEIMDTDEVYEKIATIEHFCKNWAGDPGKYVYPPEDSIEHTYIAVSEEVEKYLGIHIQQVFDDNRTYQEDIGRYLQELDDRLIQLNHYKERTEFAEKKIAAIKKLGFWKRLQFLFDPQPVIFYA